MPTAIHRRGKAKFIHIVGAEVINAHHRTIGLSLHNAGACEDKRVMARGSLTSITYAIEVIIAGMIVLRFVRGNGDGCVAHVVVLLQPCL